MHKVSSKMYEKCLFNRNKDQKNEIGIFCDPKRAVDIFISLPLIWIWSLYIDQNGKFKECLVPKYILQSTSTKSLLLCCSFFPKLRWWHDLCGGQQFCKLAYVPYCILGIIYNCWGIFSWIVGFLLFHGIYFLGCVSSQFQ